MRKNICVCLAIIVICISLTGCKHETKLTWKNINKYLNIKAEYTRVEKEDIYTFMEQKWMVMSIIYNSK